MTSLIALSLSPANPPLISLSCPVLTVEGWEKVLNLSRVMWPYQMTRRLNVICKNELWYPEQGLFVYHRRWSMPSNKRGTSTISCVPAASIQSETTAFTLRMESCTANKVSDDGVEQLWHYHAEAWMAFQTWALVCVFFSLKNKTSTLSLGLVAMAASFPLRPETSSWRCSATPGTIPASSVL